MVQRLEEIHPGAQQRTVVLVRLAQPLDQTSDRFRRGFPVRALLPGYLPARRALRADPLAALRTE
jgi:hypothetical protein